MKLYRYELKSNNDEIKLDKHTGILCGVDEVFKVSELPDVCWYFEENLELPNIHLFNTISFFTEKGNRKFHKAIKELSNTYKNKNIDVIRIEIDKEDVSDIIEYEDEYQVIITRDVYEGSTTIM